METSVLLLSYNHEQYIEQAINSILQQRYQDFEIIYLDNCSKDGSYEKAVALLERQPIPFKCIRNEQPVSVTINLNRLLAQAEGTYIAPFSSDDWMTPDYIGLKVAALKNDPSLGAVFGSGYWYYEDTGSCVEADASRFKRGMVARSLMLETDSYFWLGFVYPKSVLEALGGWDEKMIIEDLDLNVRIALRHPIDFSAEPTVYYRRHSASFMNNTPIMWDGMQRFYHKHKHNKDLPVGQWMIDNYRKTDYKATVNGNVTDIWRHEAKAFLKAPDKEHLSRVLLYSRAYLYTLPSFRKFWVQLNKIRHRK